MQRCILDLCVLAAGKTCSNNRCHGNVTLDLSSKYVDGRSGFAVTMFRILQLNLSIPCFSGGAGHGDSGLSWIGHYRAGLPHGTCWVSMLGGGWLVGRVDDSGAFTGADIAFLYSDLSTALVGEWRDSKLVAGRSGRLTGLQEVQGVLVPSFTITDNSTTNHYERWISTDSCMLCPPHRKDPYESTLVRVAKSEVEGGGEGLYARKNIPAGTLIAFYNGIRMTKEQRTPYGDTGYAIFVEWAERGRRTGDHMDLPPEVRHDSEVFILTTGCIDPT